MFSLEFLITSMIVVASPGVGVVYTIAAGLGRGGRASVVAAFACTLGILPHLAAAMLGLAALLHASALAFTAVKYAGVAYLLWMAWRTLGEKGALQVEQDGRVRSDLQTIVEGVAVNLLNPKLTLFFVAFLPQFMAPDEARPLFVMSALGGVFMLETFVVFAIYGLFAAALRDRVLSRPAVLQWMRRTFAAAFVALGAKLALAER